MDVAVISNKPQRLQKSKTAVNAVLDATKTPRVDYFTPDDCIVWLDHFGTSHVRAYFNLTSRADPPRAQGDSKGAQAYARGA